MSITIISRSKDVRGSFARTGLPPGYRGYRFDSVFPDKESAMTHAKALDKETKEVVVVRNATRSAHSGARGESWAVFYR